MSDRPPDVSVSVRAADGVELATDVYLPERQRGKTRFGAVVIRLPYGRRGPVAMLPSLAQFIGLRGWALVTQDVRGKFDSTGPRESFIHEISDGHDTLEWVTKQTWSDRRVIAAGDSYYGYTAWAAVASGHSSVRGVMARVTSPTVSSDWMYENGVFRLGNMAEWAASTWMGAEWDDVPLDWTNRDHAGLIERAFDGVTNTDLEGWATHRIHDPFWQTRDIATALLRRPIVAVHAGGWWDLMCRGQLRTWKSLSDGNKSALHLLRVDDVDHVLDPILRPGSPIVDVMADPMLRNARLPAEVQPLLDVIDLVDAADQGTILRTHPLATPAKWKVAFGEWESGQEWPPRGTVDLILHLGDSSQAISTPEGGSLTVSIPNAGVVSWTHDPRYPMPTVEHDLWRPLMSDGNHRANHERDDVATFTTGVLNHPLELCGPISVNLVTNAAAPIAHVMMSLCHVWPDGRATEIVQSAQSIHSDGFDVALKAYLGDTAYFLEPGTRLRLAISGSNYPKYSISTGTGDAEWRSPRRKQIRQWIATGPDTALRLTVRPLKSRPFQ